MMNKLALELNESDFIAFPVWEFDDAEANVSLCLRPVEIYPVDHMVDRVVGVMVKFANGLKRLCVISAIGSLADNEFMRLANFSFLLDGERVPVYPLGHPLAATFGPDALAKRLGFDSKDLFPFTYDLRGILFPNDSQIVGEWSAYETIDEGIVFERALSLAGVKPKQ